MLFVISSERQSAAGDTQAAIARQIDARRASLERERSLQESQARERLSALATRITALDGEISGKSQTELAQLDRQLATLSGESAENEARRGAVVTAPKTGTVHAINFTAGQSVAPGAALATVVPQCTALEAHLNVPSRAIGLIEPGQKVLLRYAAFPYQKYGLQHGVVAEVARSPSAQDASSSFDNLPDQTRIEACAQHAAVHEDICAMPMGYQTLVYCPVNSFTDWPPSFSLWAGWIRV